MRKTLKLIWFSFFIIAVYNMIALLISLYVEWIVQKHMFWIILDTIILLVISKIILNVIPFFIGNISEYEYNAFTIASAISWVVRVLYLILVVLSLDYYSFTTISISVFCYLLFLGLGNFFNHGLVYYIFKDNETKILE